MSATRDSGENVLIKLGYKKEKSTQYKKDDNQVFLISNISATGDRYVGSNDKVIANNYGDLNAIYLGGFTDTLYKISGLEWLKNYIYVLEPLKKITTKTYNLSAYLSKIKDSGKIPNDPIIRVKEEDKGYHVVLIKIKDSAGKDCDEYLKCYLESANHNTYRDLKYEIKVTEATGERSKMSEISKYPHNMLVFGAPGTGKSTYIEGLIDNELLCSQKAYNRYIEYFEKIYGGKLEFHNEDGSIFEYTDAELPTSVFEKIIAQKEYIEYKRHYAQRVTFYEDYGYESFVGTYKPVVEIVPDEDLDLNFGIGSTNGKIKGRFAKDRISYTYEAGPFIDLYIDAVCNPETNYYLVIEEINRAKATAVFGDMFQLLDRKSGKSTYYITPDTSLGRYLEKKFSERDYNDYNGVISLPDNLYLWATMNSADQGVFSLDSAFKRRWSIIYMDIDDEKRQDSICLIHKNHAMEIKWNTFRKSINDYILANGFDEDRCIGPWFLSNDDLNKISIYTNVKVDENTRKPKENPLVDKLLAYLRQDVFRMGSNTLFKKDAKGRDDLSSIKKRVAEDVDICDILSLEINEDEWIEVEIKDKKESNVNHMQQENVESVVSEEEQIDKENAASNKNSQIETDEDVEENDETNQDKEGVN